MYPEMDKDKHIAALHKLISKLIWTIACLCLLPIVVLFFIFIGDDLMQFFSNSNTQSLNSTVAPQPVDTTRYWQAAPINNLASDSLKKLALYGQDLIAHTAKYLGPKGSVASISNGMNCQNCHLEAGTKIYGNNYGAVFSTYPKMRARSGTVENIYKRVNDCIQRSLNGTALDSLSKEMQAIKLYIETIGSNVKKGGKATGSGLKKMDFLDRAADPEQGKIVYANKCQSCHQANGQGLLNAEGNEYTYPPLWGKNSYNDGAGLYRISNFAKYVKYNMPQGVLHNQPQLTDAEAWDVAAFVNSQTRPHKHVPQDWPDKSKKPIDHPFGPYSDQFSEQQHKYGPFKPIEAEKNKANTANKTASKNSL
jgi:thiosulfate dehydrogenase